mmetsp:Transcript_13524/g.36336  ORF Transcript_13524/g.36336 Transcript_13524/m.36336 type:complete len:229 (-) Transcript_13524:497-1183(-)
MHVTARLRYVEDRSARCDASYRRTYPSNAALATHARSCDTARSALSAEHAPRNAPHSRPTRVSHTFALPRESPTTHRLSLKDAMHDTRPFSSATGFTAGARLGATRVSSTHVLPFASPASTSGELPSSSMNATHLTSNAAPPPQKLSCARRNVTALASTSHTWTHPASAPSRTRLSPPATAAAHQPCVPFSALPTLSVSSVAAASPPFSCASRAPSTFSRSTHPHEST